MSDTAPKKPAPAAGARGTMEQTYRSAKDAAGKAIETTRGAARDAVKRTAQGADAKGAAAAAKDAGKAELDSLGLNRDAARAQVGHVINGVLQALSSAGAAAASKSKA